MKPVFVDTSGFYAFLDATDPNRAKAKAVFEMILRDNWRPVTTNYVLHESWAVIQARLGWEAVDAWRDRLAGLCEVAWVTPEIHNLGEARCRQARQRALSLTDCVSFEIMRRRGIRHAIAFDEYFEREGFLPPS